MEDRADKIANSIVAEALQKAGVPPRNINLPADAEQSELNESSRGRPTLDGSPKGEVRGQRMESEPVTPKSEPEPSKPEPTEPEVQALAKADVVALIDQASSKFQSIMDRKINQIQLQMQQTANALNQFFKNQEDSGLASLPEDEQVRRRLERLEKSGAQPTIPTQQPTPPSPVVTIQQLVDIVDTVGLKIDDKRIDWAPDTDNPDIGFNRFLKSVKGALLEDQTKAIQSLKSEGDREISKIRKKTGIDKVSTSGASGAGLPDLDKLTPMQKIEYAFQQQEVAGKT